MLINMFGWFMTSLVYYMLWFSAKSLAGDIYVNAIILGLAELPGSTLTFTLSLSYLLVVNTDLLINILLVPASLEITHTIDGGIIFK